MNVQEKVQNACKFPIANLRQSPKHHIFPGVKGECQEIIKKKKLGFFSGFLAEVKIISDYFTKTTQTKCEDDKVP